MQCDSSVSTSHCSPPAAVRSRTSAGRGPSTSVAMHPHATGARCRARAPQRRSGTRIPPRPREAASHPNRRLIAVAYGAADTLGFSRCARAATQSPISALGARDQTAMPARFGPVLAAVVDGRSWTVALYSVAGSCLLTVVIRLIVCVCTVCVS